MRKSYIEFLPIGSFTMVWLVTFGLFFLNPYYFPSISKYTWFVLLSGLFMVYIGFFTAKFLAMGSAKFSAVIKDKVQSYNFPVSRIKLLLIIFTTIGFVGVLAKGYLIIKGMGGIENYILEPSETRKFILSLAMGEGPVNPYIYKLVSYMASFVFPTVVVGGIFLVIPKNKLIAIYPLMVSFLYSALEFKRGSFIASYVYWLTSAFIFIYYSPKEIQKKQLHEILKQFIYFILIAISFSFSILLLRYYYYTSKFLLSLYNTFYFYIAGNIWFLDRYLLSDPEFLYGLSIFRSFVDKLIVLGLFEKTDIIFHHYPFFTMNGISMNTFTYIRPIYEDFGFIGVVTVSYAWGFTTYMIIRKMLRKFSFMQLGLVAIFHFALIFSFFGFNLVYLSSIIWRMFQLYLLDFYISYYNKQKLQINKISL